MRLVLAVIAFVWALTSPARGCDLALVLSMDVSRSVDPKEFQLIKHGTADAFRNREIVDLIALMKQGAFVTVVQWSGPDQNRQMVPWSKLGPKQATLDFADKIDAMVRYYRYGLTAPGEALAFANQLFSDLPTPCKRKVIDISGDGIRNIGLPARSVADAVEAQDVIINGLVVRGDTPDPLEFYQTEIKRGPLGFIQIAKGYDDFPRAMFLKLLRELSPSLSNLRP